MTPHRQHPVCAYAFVNVRSLASLPVDALGVALAALGAVAAWLVGASNVSLLNLAAGAMMMDLIVGALKAVVDPLEDFDAKKLYGGFLGKVFRMFLIPTVAMADRLVVLSGFADVIDGVFPLTKAVLFGLAAAEITSTLNKFRDGGVDPGILSLIQRHLDRTQIGAEPPARRHYDAPAIAAEVEREAQAKDTVQDRTVEG